MKRIILIIGSVFIVFIGFTQNCEEIKNERDEYKKKYEDAVVDKADLEYDVEQLSQDLQRLKNSSNKPENPFAINQKDTNNYEKKIDSLKNVINEKDRQINKSSRNKNNSSQLSDDCQKLIKELTDKRKQRKDTIKSLKNDTLKLNNHIDSLRGKINSLTLSNKSFKSTLDDNEAEIKKQDEKIKSLRGDLIEERRKTNILKTNNENLQTRIETAEKSMLNFIETSVNSLIRGTDYNSNKVRSIKAKIEEIRKLNSLNQTKIITQLGKLNQFEKLCKAVELSEKVLGQAYSSSEVNNALRSLDNIQSNTLSLKQRNDIQNYQHLLRNYCENTSSAYFEINSAENYKESSQRRANKILEAFSESCDFEYRYIHEEIEKKIDDINYNPGIKSVECK